MTLPLITATPDCVAKIKTSMCASGVLSSHMHSVWFPVLARWCLCVPGSSMQSDVTSGQHKTLSSLSLGLKGILRLWNKRQHTAPDIILDHSYTGIYYINGKYMSTFINDVLAKQQPLTFQIICWLKTSQNII